MIDARPPVVIFNPAANKGGADRRWPAIEAALHAHVGRFEVMVTNGPGHATALARAAFDGGYRRIVAVGGDGTINEAMNGLLDPLGRPRDDEIVLHPVPAGTANELCRTLGLLGPVHHACRAVASGFKKRIDLVHVTCEGLDGTPVSRFGYLLVSVGAAAVASHLASRSSWLKRLGGVAYLLASPVVAMTYRHRDVEIVVDGTTMTCRSQFTCLIGNAGNGGGGLDLLPGACLDDGVLDLVDLSGASRVEILFDLLPRLVRGTHIRHPRIRTARGRVFDVRAGTEVLVDVDGETVGRLPLRVRVVPGSLHVGVPGEPAPPVRVSA